MAAVATPLGTLIESTGLTGTTAVASGSVTAVTDDILVVVAADIGNGGTASSLTVTDSFAAVGAWTTTENHSFVSGTSYSGRLIIAWAHCTSGGSGAVTVTPSVSRDHDMFLRVIRVAGANTSTPIGLSPGANGSALGTSLTVNMGGTPATDSTVITALFVDSTTSDDNAWVTHPTGFTSAGEATSPFADAIAIGYDDGSAGSSHQWTAIDTEADLYAYAAVEIVAATVPRSPVPGRRLPRLTYR